MKPRITLLTLGVDDLERAVRFYRDGLGWKTRGIVGAQLDDGAGAFFDLSSEAHTAPFRSTLLALGGGDLERAVRFYRGGLGWKTEGIVGAQFEHGAVAFFEL